MPNENILDWSTTASENDNSDGGINWVEHMPRADVNNSARGVMAAVAKDRDLKNGTVVTTGTANAQEFASGLTPVFTTVPTGMRVLLKVGATLTNTGPTTLSLDGITATSVKNRLGNDLTGGEFKAGSYVDLVYNGTNWALWNDPPASSTTVIIQPPVVVDPPAATVEFTDLTSEYQQYSVIATGVFSDTADDTLILRYSTNNGSTWLDNTEYTDIFEQYLASAGSGNPLLYVLTSTTELSLSMILDNSDPLYPCEAKVDIHGAGRPTICYTRWHSFNFHNTAFGLCFVDGVGTHLASSSINAIQFSLLSGGEMTDGTFTIYGTK